MSREFIENVTGFFKRPIPAPITPPFPTTASLPSVITSPRPTARPAGLGGLAPASAPRPVARPEGLGPSTPEVPPRPRMRPERADGATPSGETNIPQDVPSGQVAERPQADTRSITQAASDEATRRGSRYTPEETCSTCPVRSLNLNLGWAFDPNNVPKGTYRFSPEMAEAKEIPSDGKIVLDQNNGTGIPAHKNSSVLEIVLADGPTYRFNVFFNLPAIHEPTGLKRRLTNLGLYAGIDEYFGGRAMWAIRAFKRIYQNNFQRNSTIEENDMVPTEGSVSVSAEFMAAVQSAYGKHPEDNTSALTIPDDYLNRQKTSIPDANMFSNLVLRRSSYEKSGAANDRDPRHGNQNAVWGGIKNPILQATSSGYEICLRAYNSAIGEPAFENTLNLPQPVHMLQFALFETGYWLVAGERNNSRTISQFGPTHAVGTTDAANGVFASLDGSFGRSTHWAVREFQCHAKMPQAAVEDVTATGDNNLYIERLLGLAPATLNDSERYPDDDPVSGSVNETTARRLQAWLDRQYRCPVVIYASPAATNLLPETYLAENIWRYDDRTDTTDPKIKSLRMFAIDLSNNYEIPPEFKSDVSIGTFVVPSPIIVGRYSKTYNSGPLTYPSQFWGIETTEVTPQTVFGMGGLNGDGLSAEELSTFKVIKAAAIFECFGHFDALNAYDRVTLSFGLCHWTLAALSGDTPDSAWEMGALFAFLRNQDEAAFSKSFGRYGVRPTKTWPFEKAVSGKWVSTVEMESETGSTILCGASKDFDENCYCKNWGFYYRSLMANRTLPDFQRVLGRFAANRIRGILDHQFTAGGNTYTLEDFLTSEKSVAMAHRAHIYGPGYIVGGGPTNLPARIRGIISRHPTKTQAREDAVQEAIISATSGDAKGHVQEIKNWTELPSEGLMGATFRSILTDNTLSGEIDSFSFSSP